MYTKINKQNQLTTENNSPIENDYIFGSYWYLDGVPFRFININEDKIINLYDSKKDEIIQVIEYEEK